MRAFINEHPILFVVLIVTLCVTVTGGLVAITNGFTESPIKRNPDNLITVGGSGNIVLKDKATTDGLRVTVNDQGAVTVSGDTSKSTADLASYVYAEVELKAGTYCLTSGYGNTGKGTVYMTVESGTDILAYADMADDDAAPGVFELATDTTVLVKINIAAADHGNGVTLRPVLVKGTEKGSFYA